MNGYRIIRFLGSGGMGHVYEAEHEKLGVRRAVKVFTNASSHSDFLRKRFLAEGRTLANLSHPRIVHVTDLAIDPGTNAPYFAMDLILDSKGRSRTLEDVRKEGVDEERVRDCFVDIAEALDYIHASGIVHRDVKLENVLIGPDGHAVVSDFGISRIFDENLRRKIDVTLTMQGDHAAFCMGTVCYLAPELRQEEPRSAEPAADAWALGVLLFRMLTGFWFEDANRANCLELLNDCDLGWKSVIDRLCARDPSVRIPKNGLASLALGLAHPARRVRPLPVALLAVGIAVSCAVFCIRTRSHQPIPPVDAAQFPQTDYAPLFMPFANRDADVEDVLLDFSKRREPFDSPVVPWSDDKRAELDGLLKKLDRLIETELTGYSHPRANSAQLLVLSGEVLRHKLAAVPDGDFPHDLDRVFTLARQFVLDACRDGCDKRWILSALEGTLPFGRYKGRVLGADDFEFQRKVDPWLCRAIRDRFKAAGGSE